MSRLTNRHVIRVGILARLGGIITRTPECRQPRMAPPRASTKKLTKNLEAKKRERDCRTSHEKARQRIRAKKISRAEEMANVSV